MMPSIMLIEDDARLAELVSRYLDSSGFRVTIANLDRHVANQVFELAPDLVISIWDYPAMMDSSSASSCVPPLRADLDFDGAQ